MEPLAYYTLGVIALICWVSYLGFRDPSFERRYIFWPQAILAGKQYYRLVTSAMLHADGMHLLMNMGTLYLFGSAIEFWFGGWQMLLIFFAGIIGGGLLSLFIHRHHDYRAYGASGGTCGIVFAHIILFPGGDISAFFVPIGIPSWLYAVLFLAASFYGMYKQKGNIGHDAHLGGALIGFFAAVCLHPYTLKASPILFTSISAGTFALFLYLVKNPLMLPVSDVQWFREKSTMPTYLQKERDIDAALQKISQKGLDSLTDSERALLKAASEKYRRRESTKAPDSFLPY